MKSTIITVLASVVALVSHSALAAVPDVVTVAGTLRQGDALADGTFSVVVELFDADAGGTALFTQAEPALVVVGGELIIELGSDPTNPLDGALLAGDGPRFLGVVVDGTELGPRMPLTSVPFALRARTAEVAEVAELAELATLADEAATVGGLSADDIANLYVAGDGLAKTGTTFAIAANAVNAAHLADGTVSSADLANGSVSSAKLAAGAVGTAALAADAVTANALASSSVTADALATGAVTSAKIQDGAVTSVDLANDACGAAQIADDAIDASHLKSNGQELFIAHEDCPAPGTIVASGSCILGTCSLGATQPSGCSCLVVNGTLRVRCFGDSIGFLVKP